MSICIFGNSPQGLSQDISAILGFQCFTWITSDFGINNLFSQPLLTLPFSFETFLTIWHCFLSLPLILSEISNACKSYQFIVIFNFSDSLNFCFLSVSLQFLNFSSSLKFLSVILFSNLWVYLHPPTLAFSSSLSAIWESIFILKMKNVSWVNSVIIVPESFINKNVFQFKTHQLQVHLQTSKIQRKNSLKFSKSPDSQVLNLNKFNVSNEKIQSSCRHQIRMGKINLSLTHHNQI